MLPFSFWTFILYIVYSTSPSGGPPYKWLEVNVMEFSEAACQASMTEAQLNPAPLIRTFGGKPATRIDQVTVLEGWRCTEFIGVKPPAP